MYKEPYHNTNHESGETLDQSNKKAQKQDELILKFFQENRGELFTPCQVHAEIGLNAPLTSIRRAITNLTDAGKLVKAGIQRKGLYGKMAHCWYCAMPGEQLRID